MSSKRQREVSAEEPENLDGQDAASPARGATAKKQKSPTPEPPSSTQPRVAQQAVEDDEETDEGDETDEDAEVVQRPSWFFDDEDDDDDDYWPGEEDFVFDIMSEEEIQEKADRLREEIRVALCNGLVWKPSSVRGNSSVNVEAKIDHYQVANRAFGGSQDPSDETWSGMDYPTEDFNEDFGPIHNVTGSTPLALTGTHVRINLYESMNDPLQQNMTVTVHASYGTHEARDRLQDRDVCPSDLGEMSSSDDDSSFSEDGDGEEAHRGETEDTGELDPSVH